MSVRHSTVLDQQNPAGLGTNTGSTRSFQRFADTGLNLGATAVNNVVDVTKFVGDTSLNNESFVHCVIYDFANINYRTNLQLSLDTQNTKRN